jgi:excisionase family DNA binding protein
MVTADTVLKWIKQGRIPARRTAGGHFRIHRRDIRHLEGGPGHRTAPSSAGRAGTEPLRSGDAPAERQFRYCWEYNAEEQGQMQQECRRCVVYATRAYRCYEVIKLAGVGHAKAFCKKTCQTCDYFLEVHQQATNVLVITNNETLGHALVRDAESAGLNMRTTSCEYTTSAVVGAFRPDYAIIDCALGVERSRDILHHLKVDPRIPYVRVILAAQKGEFPKDCDREVFARIETPFGIDDVSSLVFAIRHDVDGQGGEQTERKVVGD